MIFDPAPESQIAVLTQPSSGAVAGVPFTTQPAFEVLDPLGNVVTTASYNMTLAAYSDPSCTVPFAGTLSASSNPKTTVAGIAAFSGVSFTKAGPLYFE